MANLFPNVPDSAKYKQEVNSLRIRRWQKVGWALTPSVSLPGSFFGPSRALERSERKRIFFTNIRDYFSAHRRDFEEENYEFLTHPELISYIRRNAPIVRMARISKGLRSIVPYSDAALSFVAGPLAGARSGAVRLSLRISPLLFGTGFRALHIKRSNEERDIHQSSKEAERNIGDLLFRLARFHRWQEPYPGTTGNDHLKRERRFLIRSLIRSTTQTLEFYRSRSEKIRYALRQLSFSSRLRDLNVKKSKYIIEDPLELRRIETQLRGLVEDKKIRPMEEEQHTDIYFDNGSEALRRKGKTFRIRQIKGDGGERFSIIFDKKVGRGFHEDGFYLGEREKWQEAFHHLGIHPSGTPRNVAELKQLLARHGFNRRLTIKKRRKIYLTPSGVSVNFDKAISHNSIEGRGSLRGWLEASVVRPGKADIEELPLKLKGEMTRKSSFEIARRNARRSE